MHNPVSHSHNPWGCDYWIRLNGVICQRGQTDTGWLVFGDFFFFFAEEGQELVNLVSKCCCFFMQGWHLLVRYLGERMNASDWLKNDVASIFQVYSKKVLRRWIIPNASMKIKKRTSVPRTFNSRINKRTSARKSSLLVKAVQKLHSFCHNQSHFSSAGLHLMLVADKEKKTTQLLPNDPESNLCCLWMFYRWATPLIFPL